MTKSRPLTTETAGKSKILRLNRHTLRVNRGQVRVLKQRHKVGFRRLLERHHRRRLEAEVRLRTRLATMTRPETQTQTLKSCAISRTSRWNGSLRISSSVDFWYRRISRSATVPGRKRCGFFTPPAAAVAVDLRACDLAASCLRGALPVCG